TFAVDILVGVVHDSRREEGGRRASAITNIVFGGVGRLPYFIFFLIEVQASRLHSSRGFAAGFLNSTRRLEHVEIQTCVWAIRSGAHGRVVIRITRLDIFFEGTCSRTAGIA